MTLTILSPLNYNFHLTKCSNILFSIKYSILKDLVLTLTSFPPESFIKYQFGNFSVIIQTEI